MIAVTDLDAVVVVDGLVPAGGTPERATSLGISASSLIRLPVTAAWIINRFSIITVMRPFDT